MQRFLFDLVFESQILIHTNELICLDVDAAIEFIDNYYLELHGEGAPGRGLAKFVPLPYTESVGLGCAWKAKL